MRDFLNEVNDRFPIRRSEEQKAAFREYLTATAGEYGACATVENVKKNQNVVIGDPSTASVIYTAHYDTPASSVIPNLMMPRSKPLSYLYSFGFFFGLAMLCLAVAGLICNVLFTSLPDYCYPVIYLVLYLGTAYLGFFTFTNRHNKNDNTSGVATLLSILASGKAQNAAYIFFDNEEKGLLGSKAYAKAHPQIKQNAPVVNFDCVGYGTELLCVVKPGFESTEYMQRLRETASVPEGYGLHFFPLQGSMSNSDFKNFDCSMGVMACKKARILYTPRIHTPYDTVASTENIEILTSVFASLA